MFGHRDGGISRTKRFAVFERDGFRCCYCGKSPPAVKLELDHRHPRSKGGTDDYENLVTSCEDCNRGKSDHVLHAATITRLFESTGENQMGNIQWKHRMPVWVRLPVALILLGVIAVLGVLLIVEFTAAWTFISSLL